MELKRKLSVLFLLLLSAMGMTAANVVTCKQILFDSDWWFTKGEKSIMVDLPHDWDIYSGPNPLTGTTGTGGGWYPGGKGEYKKTFITPDGELVKLHFEGVYQKAEVFVNGKKAGSHIYGYTPFTIDVTPYLNTTGKKENEVVVKVDNSEQPNCRWYSGSGIYRHVWMYIMNRLHIAENGIFVTTPEITSDKAVVNVEVMVTNESAQDRQAKVTIDGKMGKNVALRAGESKTVKLEYDINNPRLWSPDTPNLYNVQVALSEENKEIEVRNVRFGVRSISFDAERGFLLNGKPTLINGACVHHDTGVLGAMAFDAAEIRKVRQMKEAGFNLIRTSHNPTTRAFMDACDSIGMLVIDEAFDGWRSPKNTYDYHLYIDSCYQEDIAAMVLRDRNHPSVISWSLGNEVIERKELQVVTTARKLKREILRYDTTRPVTEALCAWDSDWEIYDPHFEVLDIGGYNYMIHKHEGDHQRDPKRVMWQTESYPRGAFKNWAYVYDHPYIVGDIVWTGLDYLGESGIGRYYYEGETEGEHYRSGGQPEWHGAYCGDVDITGWRKPISHYREMLWNENTAPAIYMAVKEPDGYYGKIKLTGWAVWPMWESWNWKGWEGKPVEVEVYTKLPTVRLYLNGEVVETKEVSRSTEFKAVFKVPYAAGTLKAVAVDAHGNEGESVQLITAGDPVAIRLSPDRSIITADGQDLAFVTIEVVDKNGNVVPDASVSCEVSVTGKGSLLAVASADLKDTEPYTSSKVMTWKGRAMAVVRSAEKAGNIQVKVKNTDGEIPTVSCKLKSK